MSAASDDAEVLALLQLLASEGPLSLPRIGKRLQLSASQLQRLISALGPEREIGGLDLLQVLPGRPPRLQLSAKGAALCSCA